MKYAATHPFHLCVALALGTSLFAACGLEESGTVPGTSSTSSSSSGETASSSSGDGGTILTGSSSSSGGGMGGAGVSSSSSSSGGGSGQCPVCSMGTLPNCAQLPAGADDCATPGELCDAKGACACGVSVPATNTCPTSGGWEPGAMDGVCLRKCDAQDECRNQTMIVCPPGFDCDVECTGQGSCRNSTIICPTGYSCKINCAGQDACNSTDFRCSGDGPCNITCGSSNNACTSMTVDCGDNACTAMCTGASKPTLGQAPSTMSCNRTGC